MPPGITKAIIATLIDKFHVLPEKFSELTDRQIVDLCFHKRDKDGGIPIPQPTYKAPDRPLTYEEELAALESVAEQVHLTPENLAKCKNDLKKKFHK